MSRYENVILLEVLLLHVRDCCCLPLFANARVLDRFLDKICQTSKVPSFFPSQIKRDRKGHVQVVFLVKWPIGSKNPCIFV